MVQIAPALQEQFDLTVRSMEGQNHENLDIMVADFAVTERGIFIVLFISSVKPKPLAIQHVIYSQIEQTALTKMAQIHHS